MRACSGHSEWPTTRFPSGAAIRMVDVTSLDEQAPLPITAATASTATGIVAAMTRILRVLPWAVCLITAAAAALRFAEIEDVGANQFYDAAVRSMSLSWHNLFFGAFDPAGVLSVDKPPLDLWLQVLSVKLFGWSSAALKYPEALCGTLSVPLLYDAVRRAVGRPAGLGAAMALAVLPESVLTSRSDTMDSVMMLFVITALWCAIVAVSTGRRRYVVLTGVALGLAFNVKLMEALIAAPALVALYALAAPVSRRRRIADIALAGVALIGVGLSWAVAASLASGRHPWPIGSTDGTVWNVMFVFNGFGRVSTAPAVHRPGGPGFLRLVEHSSWGFDALIGGVLITALCLGAVAAVTRVRWPRSKDRPRASGTAALPVAFAISLAIWIGISVPLFNQMAILHARYLEALAPALAAAIGYGAAVLAGLVPRDGRLALSSPLGIVVALAGMSAYTFNLAPRSVAWGAVALGVAAVGAGLIAHGEARGAYAARWLTAVLVVGACVVYPIHKSLSLVRSGQSDSMGLATHSLPAQAALWEYLEPRTVGLRYELAADEPLALAPLIIHDQRPILPLTSFKGILAVRLPELKAAVQAGEVRYAIVANHTCAPQGDQNAACGEAATWIRKNGVNVSSEVKLPGGQRLYLLLPV
jgi:4-amino-4-deoxy-L-arabinose transferase-like glycosyltransferase